MQVHKIKKFIINWLDHYAKQYDIQVFVVGVSGGIDSALTSNLCALTGIKTIVVSMPIHQNKIELNNANEHIKWLEKLYPNVKSETIDLTIIFEQFKKETPVKFQSLLSLANTRARLRMTTLYQIAGTVNGLVVGTGNKVEDFGIGFFTKYGDGGVDISPIADLTKSEVRKLAEHCGITKRIITAAPTDGLWEDGRNDEDQIGATYQELEWAMSSSKTHTLTQRQKEVLKIYQKLIKNNKHKMEAIPICKIPNNLKS